MIKILIVILLFYILFNLFRALRIMLKNDTKNTSMSQFLGRRVFFSAVVLLLLIAAMATGLITPNPRPY